MRLVVFLCVIFLSQVEQMFVYILLNIATQADIGWYIIEKKLLFGMRFHRILIVQI